jgi:hypothetical protein
MDPKLHAKLVEKLQEKLRDLEPEEALSLIGLDQYGIVEAAIETKLASLTLEQLVDLI